MRTTKTDQNVPMPQRFFIQMPQRQKWANCIVYLQYQKAYLRTYAPSEDSDQPALLRSDHKFHRAHFGWPRMQSFVMQTTKTDQNAWSTLVATHFVFIFFLFTLFYCLELHIEIRRGYTWVKLVLSPSTPLPSPQCFVVLLFVLRRLLWCGSFLFVPANIQRSNNVVTTSLQRRDVAATL